MIIYMKLVDKSQQLCFILFAVLPKLQINLNSMSGGSPTDIIAPKIPNDLS